MAIDNNFYSDGPLRQHPRCKRCGDENVMWLIVKNKWRLCNNETGEPHVCPAAIRAKQDFSALKKSTRKKRPSSPDGTRTSASIEPVGKLQMGVDRLLGDGADSF